MSLRTRVHYQYKEKRRRLIGIRRQKTRTKMRLKENKAWKFVKHPIFILVLCLIGIFSVANNLMDGIIEDEISRGDVCADMTPLGNSLGYECCIDCQNLDMSYVKHERAGGGLFSSPDKNCYCERAGDVEKIW